MMTMSHGSLCAETRLSISGRFMGRAGPPNFARAPMRDSTVLATHVPQRKSSVAQTAAPPSTVQPLPEGSSRNQPPNPPDRQLPGRLSTSRGVGGMEELIGCSGGGGCRVLWMVERIEIDSGVQHV